jgi:hypothetical protein
MVRLLIEHITIRKGDSIQLDTRFRGGAVITLLLPKALSFCERPQTESRHGGRNGPIARKPDNYADTARILNEKGFKTGDGLPLTPIAVGYVRKAYGLKSRFDRHRGRELLTQTEIARLCGVSMKTISDWRQQGLRCEHTINDRAQFLFEHPGPNPPKKHTKQTHQESSLTR